MAYAYNVIRWTIAGDAFNQGEIWSTGFYTGDDAGDISDVGLTVENAENVAERWTTFFTAASTQVAEDYRTLYVKGALWGSTVLGGTHMIGEPVFFTYPTAIVGANGLPALPPQISLAASFKSGHRNGLAANGRMYIPGINKTVETNGAISDTARGEIAANFLTFINGVNTDLVAANAGKIINAGQGDLVPGPNPLARNAYVTKIRVGNYYDTQRRRRNNFNETYSELGVA